MRWQSIIKTTHIWLGLIFGVFVCLTCLSGSVAVFRSEFEAAFSPKVAPSEVYADLDAAVARVLAANEGGELTRVLLPAESRNSFILTLDSGEKRTRRIVVDAGTGAVAGELNLPWLDWVIDLHHNLLFGRTGRRFVGGVGMVLLVASATGLLLSLLRRPSLKNLVTVRVNGPKIRTYYELHRATGIWAYSFLTLLSFTGIGLAYPDTFRSVLGKAAPLPKAKHATEKSLKPLSEYLSVSRAWLNDAGLSTAGLTEMRLPKSAKDPMIVRFHEPSDLGTIGRNEIAMDARGSVVGVRRIAGETAGIRFQGAFTPVHYGEVGGLAVQVLWSLAGIAPSILFVTGLLFWLRKSPPRRGNNKSGKDASEVADELSLPLHR
jgi:uncharacterized iron-regulated membrane protein